MSKTFRGGVHPNDQKHFSNTHPIEVMDVPQILYFPVAQHIGAPAKPIVQKDDLVKKGQVIGEAGGFVSAPIHSSVSGKVLKIEKRPHIFGNMVDNIVIENDGLEEWAEGCNKQDPSWESLTPEELKNRIKSAGLVGMGGATFPTFVKLSPPPDKKIDTVILNGVECEPYLTADHMLMLEKGEGIVHGLNIIMKALGVTTGYIGIEENKPDAIEKMSGLVKDEKNISVIALPVKYPQGAEKQLIKAVLNREVPSGGLPMDVGALVQNVGTAFAAYEAVCFHKPLIERVVTVTGEGVNKPANLLVRIGTLVSDLLKKCELKPEANKVIFGGPMMGLAQHLTDIAVIKGTSGVLCLTDAKIVESGPCIRCAKCVQGCPMGLHPSKLSLLAESKRFDEMKDVNCLDCIECGVCTYVCPAKRPIVHQIKLGKAELARIRSEQMAREKQEKEAAAVAK